MCIRTVMTYASPVFAHAAPTALDRLQVIQNKFCRSATDAHWCVRNSILHRDLELPTLSKYMKDASKRFFDIAGSHPNALLRAAVDYQPPPPPLRRPRNNRTVRWLGHKPKLPYSTRPPQTAPGRVGRKEPTRDGSRRYPCRDDSPQASSTVHVKRRRHSHVSSGRARVSLQVRPGDTQANYATDPDYTRVAVYSCFDNDAEFTKKENSGSGRLAGELAAFEPKGNGFKTCTAEAESSEVKRTKPSVADAAPAPATAAVGSSRHTCVGVEGRDYP
ncbi:Probable RNA-directed DNA polymerase from transposon X-element [Eumeta japonica]|uniref:Probable RNA-directed DNA polymerase from transposon X-element n=1 Tax=Eumeta variegata TaxID=151549 RepID=A0A4C1ZRD9_EUMVA|nr:Probable RNA-directed DNA polymerase from transposon X-element [Eumeta japonica]